jgi:hypothetical protein
MTHERHEYREDCDGCQLAMCTGDGRPLPQDDPLMVRALAVWWTCSLEERRACNRVWVFNSRDPKDLTIVGAVARRIQEALVEKNPKQS